jgi:hypothetical protein
MLSACVGSIGGDPLGASDASIAPGSSSNPGAQGQQGDSSVISVGDGAAPAVVLSPTSRVARLSHTQLLNTYRDLLGITDVSAADSILTPDAVVGYDNEGDALFVTDQLWGNLQQVAELYANRRRSPTARRCPRTLAPASTASFARLHGVSSEKGQRYGKTSPFVLMMSGSLHRGHHQ